MVTAYKIKSNLDGTYSLEYFPLQPAVTLKRIKIAFPEIESQVSGSTTYHLAGPPEATITIEHESGRVEVIRNVAVE